MAPPANYHAGSLAIHALTSKVNMLTEGAKEHAVWWRLPLCADTAAPEADDAAGIPAAGLCQTGG